MRAEYYGIYQNLLETYDIRPEITFRTGPFATTTVPPASIVSLVNSAAVTAGVAERIRPDARYFLAINLMQMVVLPVSHVDAPQNSTANIMGDIEFDATTILRAAGAEHPNEEVSGHAVIDALSKVWGQLRTTAKDIWG